MTDRSCDLHHVHEFVYNQYGYDPTDGEPWEEWTCVECGAPDPDAGTHQTLDPEEGDQV